MQRSGAKLTSNESVDESDKDGNRISCSARCQKIRNFRLRFDFKNFLFVGLIPILTLAICPFFSDLQSIEDKIRQFPQETLVLIVFYYLVIATWGIWTTISDVKDKARKSFEHKILSEIQPTWLRTQEAFVTCESEEKIKNQTHKDSVDELEKVGMPGIEGGAAFVAIIILLFTLIAVLFTTLSYFMIGATFNLVEKNDGFLFVNNEGFTAAMTLLVVLVAAAVVPVYTDLGKTISERLNSFEEEISNISRNLLLIGQRMDPVWDHYQSVTNRFVPEWFLTIQEKLDEGDDQSFLNDLKASLRIDYLFKKALEENIGIEPFHEKAFLALGQECARLEKRGIFLEKENEAEELDTSKKLTQDANVFIKERLENWTLRSDKEVVSLEDAEIKKEIKNRRRYLAYQDLNDTQLIANYFPPSEWEVSLLLGDKSSNNFNDFGELLKSYFGHHMKAVLDLKEEGDRSLSSLCLKSDISTDIFLDDYHLFTALLLENNEDNDREWSQKRAREIYYAIFFFTSQDSQSKRSEKVRAFKKPDKKKEPQKGQVFFEELFSDICTLVKESENKPPNNSEADQQQFLSDPAHEQLLSDPAHEQLLLDLTYERSALHNWIRASQSVTRRKVWIDLSNELSHKVKNRKVIPSLWGLPIVPTRDRRLHDLMRHAGVPIIDKKRLRLLSIKDISEEVDEVKTKEHIEKILKDKLRWVSWTRENVIRAGKLLMRYEEFIKAIPRLTQWQKKALRVKIELWIKNEQSKPSDTAINFWRYFLEKVDQTSVDDGKIVAEKMTELLDADFDFKTCIEDLLQKKQNYFENECELIRRLKFLDPMLDEIWTEFTDKVTKEDLTRETLKKYTKYYENDPEKSPKYKRVPLDKITSFKRSLKLKHRPGIGKKEDIFSFELSKFFRSVFGEKVNVSLEEASEFATLKFESFELSKFFRSEFGEKVNVSLEAALRFATKMFVETNNPFWCSFKKSYLEREESNLKMVHQVRVEEKDFIWRKDDLVWNIALESIHTPDFNLFENKAHIGHPKQWLEYSLKQCEKLGFTSVAHAYIVYAVKEWDKDETLDEKNSCEIAGPDGSTTWKRINDKWKVTAHSFKIINRQEYIIWRLSINNNWDIALESMHTPSAEVKKSVENWLEYSLKQCEKLGFTSVDHDYLKEAVAVWSEDTDWSEYENVKNSSNFKREGLCWNQQKS